MNLNDPQVARSLTDKDWRIANLYTIVDKNQQATQFRRNEAQRHFAIHKHIRNLILKSRQLGFTTDRAIDMVDDIAFTPNFHALFLAHIKEEAQRIFSRKIKYAWEKYPLRNLYKTVKNDAGTLELDFGESKLNPQYDRAHSSIYVSNSGRSGTYAKIHVSEIAKMERVNSLRANEFVSGTIPALPISCGIDIESTAEGDFGLWYDMYNAAMERWEWLQRKGVQPMPTDWKPHFYNWTWDKAEIAQTARLIPFSEMKNAQYFKDLQRVHNLTDLEISYYYVKYMTLNYDLETLQQEYPTTWQEAFVSSGGKFFPLEMLAMQRPRAGIKSGEWTFYTKYDPKHRYVFGVDTSGGKGGDNAVIEVVDAETGEQAAEYVSDTTDAEHLAIEAVMYARKYGNALIVPEINNHGLAFVVKCKELGYSNLYVRVTFDKDLDKEQKEIGFNMNRATKPLLMYSLAFTLGEMGMLIYSELALQEIRSYPKSELDDFPTLREVRDGNKKHWDRVIGLALCREGMKVLATGGLSTGSY